MRDAVQRAEAKVETLEDVARALARISFQPSCLDMGWEWRVESMAATRSLARAVQGGFIAQIEQPPPQPIVGWMISCSFQRPDTDTGKIGRGFGRREFIAAGSTISAVVKTAWVCVEKTVYHELMEAFSFDGARVFDPHKSVFELIGSVRRST